MRRKQKTVLRTRYFTDITSRWKLGAPLDELRERLDEYYEISESTEAERTAFGASIRNFMFDTVIADYEDLLAHDRVRLQDLRHYIARESVSPSVRERLKTWLQEKIKATDDALFDRLVATYTSLVIQGASFNDLFERVVNEKIRESVRTRLWNLVEKWERDAQMTNELARLAGDAQNIHTPAVNRQTNELVVLLHAVPIPGGQKTMAEILAEWTRESFHSIPRIENDMRTWASKSFVVTEGDFLYRNTLRSLWAKIKATSGETRRELTKRLWEECLESVGMCAAGHISRLINVLVGFDAAFVVPMSLQDRMAAISLRDVDSATKIAEATRIMDELGMPAAERQPWLEAF